MFDFRVVGRTHIDRIYFTFFLLWLFFFHFSCRPLHHIGRKKDKEFGPKREGKKFRHSLGGRHEQWNCRASPIKTVTISPRGCASGFTYMSYYVWRRKKIATHSILDMRPVVTTVHSTFDKRYDWPLWLRTMNNVSACAYVSYYVCCGPSLVRATRQRSIPTVFWIKADFRLYIFFF